MDLLEFAINTFNTFQGLTQSTFKWLRSDALKDSLLGYEPSTNTSHILFFYNPLSCT